jgi:hypothetical protein
LAAIDGFAGVIAIEMRAGVTVTLNELATEPILALTEHCPLALAVSIPPDATVAILGLAELHVTVAVTSFELPSL